VSGLVLELPESALAEIAERAAAIVLERLAGNDPTAAAEYLTLTEACAIARCKSQRIYDLRSQGRLTKYGDGASVRVSRAELLAHLAGHDDVAERAHELLEPGPSRLAPRPRTTARSGSQR